MVKGVSVGADGVAHVGGLPHRGRLPDARDDHHAGHRGRVEQVPGVSARAGRAGRDERRAAHRAAPQPARRRGGAGDPVRPARLADPGLLRGVGQGRGRQVVGHGQPGRRDGRPRPLGRRRRRRHLRPLGAPHAGHHRPAHQGRGHDHAAAGARREGHLDRHVHPGQRRRGLARPDAAPRAAAVPRRRVLGRPGRAAARPARPAPATSRSPPRSWCRTPSCWWSPRRRRPRPRWPSGPARSRCRPGSASPASSRTCPGWSCPTAPGWRCSASGGGQAVADSLSPVARRARAAARARSRWRPRLRECGDAGTPIVLAEPESPAATALRRIADRLVVRSRGLSGRSLNITPA